MMKKFLSLVVAALLTVSAVATSASAAKFTDVDASNEALNDAVELLVALGVTKGTSETTFGTDENVTREQMAAFVYRMMKAGKSVEGGTNVSPFTDLDDPTFYFMISWAASQDIIKGTSATTFNPKGGITLQDAYTMIVRALGYDNGTLTYPIGHINMAEDLGLDENLPSTLNYGDTLTRGNLAIILANMFYAETAETEIRYETEVVDWEEKEGTYHPITSQKPVEYRKTVAEAIFGVEEVTYAVVATPNASFEGAAKPDEDIEMISLREVDVDENGYRVLADGEPVTIEFADLGLAGKADDYILSDLLVFEREDKNGDTEIFGATALGTKKTVSFADVKFGTVTGTAADNYYDNVKDGEYKKIDGKVTLGDVVTYLNGTGLKKAPLSFTKGDGNIYAEFITLGDWTNRAESEEDPTDVNFNYEIVDVTVDASIIGTYVPAVSDNEETEEDESADAYFEREYLSQVYFGGLGEIDVYDCDGNGKPDYLFVKNYTVGTIDTEEDTALETHDEDITGDEPEAAIIYTDASIVEGVEFADEDVVLAYVNVAANYAKVVEVLEGVENTISTTSDNYYAFATGEKVFYENADMVVTNATGVATAEVGDEGTFYFTADGVLVYATDLETAFNLDENWVIVLEDEAYESANMVDGKLERAYYINIYNDGAIKSIKAKNIVDGTKYADDDTPATQTTKVVGEDTVTVNYYYGDYVNQLATGKADKNGAYYFNLLLEGYEAVEDNEETEDDESMTAAEVKEAAKEALKGSDETAEYRNLTAGAVKFYQNNGYRYYLGSEIVNIKPYTQIIIRAIDEEGEEIVTAYGYDNLPNIKEETEFSDVQYVLVNNTGSTRYENLAVFYGVLNKEMEGAMGEIEELRVVYANATTATEDETTVTYDVLNPFKGVTEAGLEGAGDELASDYAKGNIYGLTSEGYIEDREEAFGNAFAAGDYYDVDNFNAETDTLGYSTVASFDEAAGYLEIVEDGNHIFEINADTVITFANKAKNTIKVVDAAALASKAGTYKEEGNKNVDTKVFLCVEESDDFDDNGTYIVKFAMIVRTK